MLVSTWRHKEPIIIEYPREIMLRGEERENATHEQVILAGKLSSAPQWVTGSFRSLHENWARPRSRLHQIPTMRQAESKRGFPGGSVEKNLPTTQEMRVQSLSWEDTLQKEMAIHSSILP